MIDTTCYELNILALREAKQGSQKGAAKDLGWAPQLLKVIDVHLSFFFHESLIIRSKRNAGHP